MAARKSVKRPRSTSRKARSASRPRRRAIRAKTVPKRKGTKLPRRKAAKKHARRQAAQTRPAKARRSPAKSKRPAAKVTPKRGGISVRRRKAPRSRVRPAPARTVAPKAPPKPAAVAATRPAPKATPRARSSAPRERAAARPATLERERRRLPDSERLEGLSGDRMISAARAGHDELRSELLKRNETSPVLTAGDIDANWQEAYAIGDEAPGGDNPTPDQDRVDDIGKALGIQYRDDEELKGGEEVTERDRHRWELDPASSEDWPHDRKKD